MKGFIVIIGGIVLGVILVGFMIGVGGNRTGSLAGAAGNVVAGANTQIQAIAP